jgi:hypothetical protein
MIKDQGIIHLLWTGGWDSTFRLLQLVIIQKRTVQTHYLVDPNRRSVSEEFHSMGSIKQEMFARFPETKARMCPTIITDITDIPPNAQITDTYHRVLQRQVLGTQYEWLARYAKASGINGIELGINRGHNPGLLIDPLLVWTGEGIDEISWVDERYKDTDAYRLFGYYRFPNRIIPKQGKGDLCKQQGLFDLLNMTWFCHFPRPNHTACGVCSPCSYNMENGLSGRIPLMGRIRYFIAPVKIKQRLMNRYYRLTGTGQNKLNH